MEDLPSLGSNHDCASLPFQIDCKDEISRWRGQTFWVKEPETLVWIDFFSTQYPKQLIFVDVGANIGMYSLYAASKNHFAKVYASEPMPANFQQLQKNISLNPWNNVIAVNSPFFSKREVRNFSYTDQRVGSASGSLQNFVVNQDATTLELQTITGDEIFINESEKLLLKIDVDGNEVDILYGFEQCFIANKVLSILIELDLKQVSTAKNYLNKFGMKLSSKFDEVSNHSSKRRIIQGSSVRNLIFELEDQELPPLR